MPSTNIVQFPKCPLADSLSDALIFCAVVPEGKESFSYEHDPNVGSWVLSVRARTIDGLISALFRCKRELPSCGKEAAAQ